MELLNDVVVELLMIQPMELLVDDDEEDSVAMRMRMDNCDEKIGERLEVELLKR